MSDSVWTVKDHGRYYAILDGNSNDVAHCWDRSTAAMIISAPSPDADNERLRNELDVSQARLTEAQVQLEQRQQEYRTLRAEVDRLRERLGGEEAARWAADVDNARLQAEVKRFREAWEAASSQRNAHLGEVARLQRENALATEGLRISGERLTAAQEQLYKWRDDYHALQRENAELRREAEESERHAEILDGACMRERARAEAAERDRDRYNRCLAGIREAFGARAGMGRQLTEVSKDLIADLAAAEAGVQAAYERGFKEATATRAHEVARLREELESAWKSSNTRDAHGQLLVLGPHDTDEARTTDRLRAALGEACFVIEAIGGSASIVTKLRAALASPCSEVCQDELVEPSTAATSQMVSRAMNRFKKRLYEVREGERALASRPQGPSEVERLRSALQEFYDFWDNAHGGTTQEVDDAWMADWVNRHRALASPAGGVAPMRGPALRAWADEAGSYQGGSDEYRAGYANGAIYGYEHASAPPPAEAPAGEPCWSCKGSPGDTYCTVCKAAPTQPPPEPHDLGPCWCGDHHAVHWPDVQSVMAQPTPMVSRDPSAPPKYNGGQRCDVDVGPCSCGATHMPAEGGEELCNGECGAKGIIGPHVHGGPYSVSPRKDGGR